MPGHKDGSTCHAPGAQGKKLREAGGTKIHNGVLLEGLSLVEG